MLRARIQAPDVARSRPARLTLAAAGWMLTLALLCSMAHADSSGDDPEYLITAWEVEDGLPENSATAIVQTDQGQLWIGTFGGLVRFDGFEFTLFNRTNTPQLGSDGIVNLHLDQANRLWVSTLSGLACYADGQWRSLGESSGWVGNYARTIAERDNGDLLFTTFDGRVLTWADGKLSALTNPPGESGQGYHGFVDAQGRWGVAQHKFIGHWTGTAWESDVDPQGVRSSRFAAVNARDGGHWILLDCQLRKYRDGAAVTHFTLPELKGGIWSLSEDSSGNVWIATFDSGLYRVDPRGEVRRWTTNEGLSFDGVRCLFEDREQNLWVGTSGGGLMRFVTRRASEIGVPQGLTGSVVNSLCPDRAGNVWVATYDKGLFRWDGSKATPIDLSDDPIKRATLCQCVLADTSGRVWAGHYGEGLWRITAETVERIPDERVGDRNILALFEDSSGCIWFGGGDHLASLDHDQYRVYSPDNGWRGGGAICFAEDSTGSVWLSNGSSVFATGPDGFTEVLDSERESIADVRCLYCDGESVWMGLRTGRLLRRRAGLTTPVRLDPAIGVTSVRGMVGDRQGVLWLATDRGVVRCTLADLAAAADGNHLPKCQLLTTADGLPSNQCAGARQPVCGRDADGRLWFATTKGVATIDPTRFVLNSTRPPAVINELVYMSPSEGGAWRRENRRRVVETRLTPPFDQQVVLPAGSRRVEFHFAGLSLTAPTRVHYQVKLDGWDDQWQSVENRRLANYHDLSPGDYAFRVRAVNADGVWSAKPAQLSFQVLPFFWQTLWFRSGGVLSLIALSSGAAWWGAHSRHRRRVQADERFRLIVEATPNALVVLQPDGQIVLVNAQAESIFGYRREDLIGRSIGLLIPSEFRDDSSDRRATLIERAGEYPTGAGHETSGRRHDASELILNTGMTVFEGSQGPLILASFVDVTDRRRRAAELAQQRRALAHLSRVTMLGELSGSLAHELNQPLTAILSNVQAAQRYLDGKEPNLNEVREILGDVIEDNQRAGDTIRRVRALFQQGELNFAPLELAQVIADVAKLVKNDAVLRQVNFTQQIEPDLPVVRGDRIQLQQVLLNLLLNAFDAFESADTATRRVWLTAATIQPTSIRICIRDSGPGLSDEAKDKIFHPFFTTKSTGMGIGLSISRSIVTAHGGKLTAENDPAGGAIFSFTLPYQANDDGQAVPGRKP